LASLPFAIWFFLGIEGVANVAEETLDPQRTIPKGFGSAMTTLVVLCLLTFTAAVGVGGWKSIVYKVDGSVSDSPLPLALGKIVGESGLFYHLLITVGLFGLIASFHGLILAAGRATFEFGRVRFAPSFLGDVHPKFQTPSKALVANMAIGIVALLTGRTSEIITISVFGALTLYALSMIALLKLRRNEPGLSRPFKVPFYPLLPVVALIISFVSFLAMAIFNWQLAIFYFLILGGSYVLFKIFHRRQK
jgi:ethanolamine permease